MYFPYLRGKQYELLALKELIGLPLNPEKIIPIIEPVTFNTSSLESALKKLSQAGIRIQLIVNPEVGELKAHGRLLTKIIQDFSNEGVENIIPTYIIRNEKEVIPVQESIIANNYNKEGYALIHLNKTNNIQNLSDFAKNSKCLFNTIHFNILHGHKEKFEHRALLNDYFIKQIANVNYIPIPEEMFSTDYLEYPAHGCIGFSDYQTIGHGFKKGGGPAYAVAIHLTFKDNGDGDIRVAHFVSDYNDDQKDPARKFFEALDKLIKFAVERNVTETLGLAEFRKHHENQTYPGLGVVKKLSIMHHIELMQGLI